MERCFEVVQDRQGNAISSAVVTIKDASGNVATIFSDNGSTTAANPLTTNSDGEYTFFAANGVYTHEIVATGYASEIISRRTLFDPTISHAVAFTSLTDGTNIAVDASLSNNFKVTLGGNRTLDNPTNLRDGMVLNFKIKQDGTGTRTLAFGSKYKWPGGSTPPLSPAANAVDLICAQYDSGDDILLCNMLRAFA